MNEQIFNARGTHKNVETASQQIMRERLARRNKLNMRVMQKLGKRQRQLSAHHTLRTATPQFKTLGRITSGLNKMKNWVRQKIG